MQGQKGAIGSFPESLAMEHGSASTDSSALEHQICWTNFMRTTLANDPSELYLNTTNQENQTLNMWSLGESSSNQLSQNRVDQIPEHVNIGHLSSPLFTQTSRAESVPRKRKASELSIGQSSSGIQNSTIFQTPEGSTSVRHSFSDNSSDPIIPRLGLTVGGVSSDNRSYENTRRNVRIRINNSRQQDSLPTTDNNVNNNNNYGQLNFSASYPSLGLNLVAPTGDNSSIQESRPVSQVPAPRRNSELSSRSRSSSSRANRSVSLNIGSSRDNSRTVPRNISNHPLLISPPETNWNLNPSNVTNTGNISVLRGSSQHPSRRLSDILRHSLLSSVDSSATVGNLFSRIPPPVSNSTSFSQEVGIPPVIGMPRHHPAQTQLEGVFGFPYLARPVAGGSERRGRLVSEWLQIRNVLDLIRRGEGLRSEDVMLLDHSMLYGMADVHDRHRDMRLDIDNMSYEELLALEERIGNVNTGLTEETISSCMKLKTYMTMSGQPDAEPCCICQEEYKNGDDLGGLKCGHDFHKNCIKKWLLQKNACPVCKSAAAKTKD